MPAKKQPDRNLNRIRRHDDVMDEEDSLDELTQSERVRKQPRNDSPPTDLRQQRRQQRKAWGRNINKALRKLRQDDNHKP